MESQPAAPFSGAPILRLRETTSTMDEARSLAEAGAPRGSVVLAEHQSSGRGRGPGRTWLAVPGASLLCTIVLDAADAALPGFPLRVGLALLRAVEAVLPAARGALRIKWPNDLVLPSGKPEDAGRLAGASKLAGAGRLTGASKLAGILCEGASGRAFAGLGLNLARQPWPPDCKLPPLSLEEAFGRAPGRDEILLALLRELERVLGEDSALGAVESRLYGLGQMLRFSAGLPGSQPIEARLAGLDASGSIRLRLADGGEAAFASGEVLRD